MDGVCGQLKQPMDVGPRTPARADGKWVAEKQLSARHHLAASSEVPPDVAVSSWGDAGARGADEQQPREDRQAGERNWRSDSHLALRTARRKRRARPSKVAARGARGSGRPRQRRLQSPSRKESKT